MLPAGEDIDLEAIFDKHSTGDSNHVSNEDEIKGSQHQANDVQPVSPAPQSIEEAQHTEENGRINPAAGLLDKPLLAANFNGVSKYEMRKSKNIQQSSAGPDGQLTKP